MRSSSIAKTAGRKLLPLLMLCFAASAACAQDAVPGSSTPQTNDKAAWTDQRKAEMAENVRQEFLHAWGGYKQYAWGHDELRPLSKGYRDWYSAPIGAKAAPPGGPNGTSLLMTPVDALDTMVLMGLTDEATADRELIDKQSVVRPGHLRQELRDHDSPAGRTAQQLSAHRRSALAGAGRRPGPSPAACV